MWAWLWCSRNVGYQQLYGPSVLSLFFCTHRCSSRLMPSHTLTSSHMHTCISEALTLLVTFAGIARHAHPQIDMNTLTHTLRQLKTRKLLPKCLRFPLLFWELSTTRTRLKSRELSSRIWAFIDCVLEFGALQSWSVEHIIGTKLQRGIGVAGTKEQQRKSREVTCKYSHS